ncbi:unnamed protein product [Orchesella dallaii]|uniref:Peptidase S1 domain-containing protein n=1 Tax=Orchesella dallaii TaxID=48710 RepID=A0ABP1RIM4_9HEXA
MWLKLIVAILCLIATIESEPYGRTQSHWRHRWQRHPSTKLRSGVSRRTPPIIHKGPGLHNMYDPELTGRIVGGRNAAYGEVPYQLYMTTDGELNCGATLVEVLGLQAALTAAHCVWSGYPDRLSPVPTRRVRIIGGDLNLIDTTGHEQYRRPTEIIIHEGYDVENQPHNDIAIMFLDRPFTLNDYVMPADLPGALWAYPNFIQISGWGSTTKLEPTFYPDDLMIVTVPTISTVECKRYEYFGNYINWKQICVRVGGFGPCTGKA